MDGEVNVIESASTLTQQEIYKYLTGYINTFQIEDGRFVLGQDYSGKIAAIQRKMTELIGKLYRPAIPQYLNSYKTIEEINVGLQRSYNQLEVDVELLTPARKAVYNQAAYYMKEGLADAYVQPAKYLIMQGVTNGITLKDAQRVLKKWNDGELSAGSTLTSGRATPNLNKYAVQVARDSIYGYNGVINEIIADEYELDHLIYVGDVISDSRPSCAYLVGLKRKIALTEIPAVLKKYPQGIIPGTTMKNFFVKRCGYNCRHSATAVRGPR